MPPAASGRASQVPPGREQAPQAEADDERPSIVEFTTSPQYLGLNLSVPQAALLKASYGLPLDPAQLDAFRLCTGRTVDPRRAFRTVVAICGARAGKDSRLVAPTVLYEGIFGGHALGKGEGAVGALFAQDKDAAGVTLDYITSYLLGSPRLKRLVADEPLRRSVALKSGFTIRTYPATRKAARAYSFPVAVLNESAFFRFEGSANADIEIETSVRRGMVNFTNPKLLVVSTPYAKSGILYSYFQRFYGRDDSMDVLVWRAPSAFMNPSITQARLDEEQRAMDPSRFAREFLAEFTDDLAAWLPGDLIEAAVDIGVVERQPQPGVKYTMAIDASGAGACGFAVTIGHLEQAGAQRVVVQDVGRVYMKPSSGKLNLRATVREILALAEDYKVTFAFSDRYAGSWPAQTFEEVSEHRFTLRDPQIRRAGDLLYLHKSDAFVECTPLFRTGSIRLLDLPSQVRELRNLEARPTEGGRMKISKPMVRGELDDQATALATAAAMLVHSAVSSFHIPPSSYTVTTGERADAFWRGKTPFPTVPPPDPAQPPKPAKITTCQHGVDVEDAAHRVDCRDAKRKWRSTPEPGASTLINAETGTHAVKNPKTGRTEYLKDPRGLGPEPAYEQCQTCGARYPAGGSCGRERCRS